MLALVALASGCGGARFSEGPEADAGIDRSEAAIPDVGAADTYAGNSDVGVPDTGSEATLSANDAGTDAISEGGDAGDACVPITYFLDGDGDGYGGTTTSKGCVPPDSRPWVTMSGDCDDSNATVNPGQTTYFAMGYVPTGKTSPSFDYDCDGAETESGMSDKAACQTVNLTCKGSGYIEASPVRSGAGVDPFCGSAQAVTCASKNLSCQAGAPYATTPIACR